MKGQVREQWTVAEPMDKINELHLSLVSHAHVLNATSSTLSKCISIHSANDLISLSQLETFLKECLKTVEDKSCYNIGSLVGKIVVSVNLQSNVQTSNPQPYRQKRSYDDSRDRAVESVNAARVRLQKSKDTTMDDDHLNMAQDTIEKMFRNIRGFNDELVIESLGLSVSPNKMFQNSTNTSTSATTNFSTRPQLIIACRLSGGVAIPIDALKSVLSHDGAFFDGMFTTNVESLGPEYRLPMNGLGKSAASQGQKSMLLFVAVPHPTYPKLVKMPRDDEDDSDRPSKARKF